MLTDLEYSQLKTALECMYAHNINGDRVVSQNNVLVLVGRFTEAYAREIAALPEPDVEKEAP